MRESEWLALEARLKGIEAEQRRQKDGLECHFYDPKTAEYAVLGVLEAVLLLAKHVGVKFAYRGGWPRKVELVSIAPEPKAQGKKKAGRGKP